MPPKVDFYAVLKALFARGKEKAGDLDDELDDTLQTMQAAVTALSQRGQRHNTYCARCMLTHHTPDNELLMCMGRSELCMRGVHEKCRTEDEAGESEHKCDECQALHR